MMSHEDIQKVPILFFANKKDLVNVSFSNLDHKKNSVILLQRNLYSPNFLFSCSQAMSPVECAKYLELEGIQNHPWQIVHSNGLTGEGLGTGIDWLAQSLS